MEGLAMYLYTSESVSAGHPDKCADIIADTIVDRLLQLDPASRVATEVFISGRHIIIGGEVKSSAPVSKDFYRLCAQDALYEIGYPESGFDESQTLYPDNTDIQVLVSNQSPDISIGVEKEEGEIGAGDQGMMIGFATDETPALMPAALYYSRILRDALYSFALENGERYGIDIKTQVTIDYETKDRFDSNRPAALKNIVAAIPHSKSLDIETVRTEIEDLILKTLAKEPLFNKDICRFYINGTGRYVTHSTLADSGMTGRKTVADTYGAYAPIGGGAQSSKDYTKVDRSGLYAARWIAKHIVASKIAKKAVVELAYVIGEKNPLNVTVNTMGTSVTDATDEEISEKIASLFPLTPRWITDRFGLNKPSSDHFLYADVAARGQVGYDDYPWEKLDMMDLFKTLV